MKEEIIINRTVLYRQVWSYPVTEVAKQYGISDVGLAKICKKLNIPKPGLGYWAKKQNGHKVQQLPLPKLGLGDTATYTIRKAKSEPIETESEDMQKARVFESKPENKVVVKSTLRGLHPHVQQTKAKLKDPHTDQYYRCSGGLGAFRLAVCKPSIRRTLLILDALIKALETRGYSSSLSSEYGEKTAISINNEEISFTIQESVRQIPNPTPRHTGSLSLLNNKWDYVPTGKLMLRIDEYLPGTKSIRDGKVQRVEEKLNEFIFLLIKTAETKKVRAHQNEIRRKEDEKRTRIEREALLKREREKELLQQLFANSATWNKCVLARNYIAAIRTQADEESADRELDSWVLWATQQVERVEAQLHPSVTESQ